MFKGRPRPKVVWYLENELKDESYEQRYGEQLTVNHFVLRNVKREYLNHRLLCQASNNNLEPPASKVVVLDLNRKWWPFFFVFSPSFCHVNYQDRI